MRNPTLHINKTDFVNALKKCGLTFADSKINQIFRECYKNRITNRYLLTTNKKLVAEKILKLHKNDNNNIDLFHKLLNAVRQKRHHNYISKITSNSSNYNLLKEICGIADEFCEVFDLDQNQGYVDFCSIALDLMGKNYRLSKFKFLAEKIFNLYQWSKLILEDDSKDLTEDVINYYEKTLSNKGIDFKVSKLDEQIHFFYAKNEILEHNASVNKWVDSQFSEMEFLDVFPNPNQLYGGNALNRYKKYIINNPEKRTEKTDDEDTFDYNEFFEKN